MEQVLRKIYNRKHTQIQRQKFQSQRQSEKRPVGQRYRRIISKKYQHPYTPSTDFSLDEQYRYKRELQFGNKFLLINQNDIQVDLQKYKSHQNTFFLPKIQRTQNIFQQPQTPISVRQSNHQFKTMVKQKYKNLKLIFRTKVIAIMFIQRLKKNYKSILIINKSEMQKYATQFLQIVNKTVNTYYVPLLKQQLNTYFTLLQVQIRKPAAKLHKQILGLILQMTAKLSKSTIRKDLLHFLILVSQQSSFFPSDFLSQQQISRLDLNYKFGYLQNVTEDQSRMIVGVCLGIKIFCVYVLYKPWLLNFQHPNLTTDAILKYYDRAKKLIFQIGSVFYYIILQQYLQVIKVRPKQKDKIKVLKSFQLKQLQSINVIPQTLKKQSDDESQKGDDDNVSIISKQTKDFYSTLEIQFPDALDSIRINIIKWLDRIVLGVKNQHNIEQKKRMQIRKKDKMHTEDIVLLNQFNKKLALIK